MPLQSASPTGKSPHVCAPSARDAACERRDVSRTFVQGRPDPAQSPTRLQGVVLPPPPRPRPRAPPDMVRYDRLGVLGPYLAQITPFKKLPRTATAAQ